MRQSQHSIEICALGPLVNPKTKISISAGILLARTCLIALSIPIEHFGKPAFWPLPGSANPVWTPIHKKYDLFMSRNFTDTCYTTKVLNKTYNIALDMDNNVWLCEYKPIKKSKFGGACKIILLPIFGPVAKNQMLNYSTPENNPFIMAAQTYFKNRQLKTA